MNAALLLCYTSTTLGLTIFISQALCIASNEQFKDYNRRWAAIGAATVAIVFAGTPHRGSSKAAWGSIATNIAKVVLKDQNDKVIDALNRGSETLERLQWSFSGVLPRLKIVTCLEDLNYSKAGKVHLSLLIARR